MLAGSIPTKVGRPKKDLVDCQHHDSGTQAGVLPRQDRSGSPGLELDPVHLGRMVGDRGRGHEDLEQFRDLRAQARDEGGGGQLVLIGLVASDQVFGVTSELGDLLSQPSILGHERGRRRIVGDSLLEFAGMLERLSIGLRTSHTRSITLAGASGWYSGRSCRRRRNPSVHRCRSDSLACSWLSSAGRPGASKPWVEVLSSSPMSPPWAPSRPGS
jgi:hypothetical protein